MRKFFLVFPVLFFYFAALSQTRLSQLDTIIVGQENVWTSIRYLPVDLTIDYSYSQMIYEADEIRRPMVIDKIGFWVYVSSFNDSYQWDFFIGLTDKNGFSSTSDYLPVDSVASPQFYDSYNTYKDLLIIDIPDFTYSGDSNLVIGVLDKIYGSEDYPSYFLGYLHGKNTMKAIGYRSTFPVDPHNPPAANFTNSSYLPQMMLIGYPLAYQTDAALMKILTDSVQSSDEPVQIRVQIRNHGTDNLSSLNINWQISDTNGNTVSTGTYAWSGSLQTNQYEDVTIGSVNLDRGQYLLTVYISNPNNTTDQFTASDTLVKKLLVSPGCRHEIVMEIPTYNIKTGTLSVYVGDSLFYKDLDIFNLAQISYPVMARTGDTVFIKYSVLSSSYTYASLYWKFYDNKGNLLVDDYVYDYYIVDTALPECKLDYDLSVDDQKFWAYDDFLIQNYDFTPVITVKNIGKQPATGFDVNLKIAINNNLFYDRTVTVTDTVFTDQTLDIAFQPSINITDTGQITATCQVFYTDDLDTSNNKLIRNYEILEASNLESPALFSFTYNKVFKLDTNLTANVFLDTMLIPYIATGEAVTLWGTDYNNFYMIVLLNGDDVVLFNSKGKSKYLGKILVDGQSSSSCYELKYDVYNDKLWLLYMDKYGYKHLAEYDPTTNTATTLQGYTSPLLGAVDMVFLGDGSIIYVDQYGNFKMLDSLYDTDYETIFEFNVIGYPYQADLTLDRLTGNIYYWFPTNVGGYYVPVLYKFNIIDRQTDSIAAADYSYGGLAFAGTPGYKLPVKIVDSATTKPIAYAKFRYNKMIWKTGTNGTRTVSLPGGTYKITAYANSYVSQTKIITINGQDADTLVFRLTKGTGTQVADRDLNTFVYPNPAYDRIFINLDPPFGLKITDMTGKILVNETAFYNNWDISRLQRGIYIIEVKKNGKTAVGKLIKN